MNGIKLSKSNECHYNNVSSAIITLSLDDFILDDNTDYITINLCVSAEEDHYIFPIYITNNTLD